MLRYHPPVRQVAPFKVEKERHRRRRLRRPALVVLLWLAYAVRVISLDAQGLWRDEVDQWRFALQPIDDLFGFLTRPEWNGPLYSPLLRGWIALAGESVFAMRMSSLLFGVLAVALTYALARRLASGTVPFVAALLMALSPYMVWYAQEIKMYTLVQALVLLALYALDRACARPQFGWWVALLVVTSLAIYLHILAALLIPVLFLWFWLHPRRHPRAWVGGLAVLLALTLPYLPLLQWQLSAALEPRETGFPRYTLGQMISVLINAWSAGIYQGQWGRAVVILGVMIYVALLATWGLVRSAFGKRHLLALQLLLWGLLPVVAVWGVSLRVPIFTDRYFIWSAPAYYVLVALGFAGLRRSVGRWAVLVLLPLLVFNVHGLYSQAVDPFKPEFAEAVAYVREHRGRDAEGEALLLFQIPYNHFVFEYYMEEGLGAWAEAPYTNRPGPDGGYDMDPAELGRGLRRLLMGHARVWLVYSEAALWDQRELVKTWLDENYELVDAAHFHGVSLYAYERLRQRD